MLITIHARALARTATADTVLNCRVLTLFFARATSTAHLIVVKANIAGNALPAVGTSGILPLFSLVAWLARFALGKWNHNGCRPVTSNDRNVRVLL